MMSANSLHVPLDIGTWGCELVPAQEFFSMSGGYLDHFSSFDERRKRMRQVEEDRAAFIQYFTPNYDFRRSVATDIDAIRGYLREHLRCAHWNLPTDNDGIARILKRAVSDGHLVPVIDRERRIPARTMRAPHRPQYWRSQAKIGGGDDFWSTPRVLTGAEFDALRRTNGELIDEAPTSILGLCARIAPVSRRGGSAAGGDRDCSGWMACAGTVGVEAATPLSDAQPFEFAGNAPIGDAQSIAARGVSELQEAECFAEYERHLDECNLYKGMTDAAYTFIACKQNAFLLYNQCRGY